MRATLAQRARQGVLRLLALAAALALCTALGGCGRSRAAGHAPRASQRAGIGASPTRSQAEAFARAVNLKSADVPGFMASPRHEAETPQEKQLQRRLRACVGRVRVGGGVIEDQSASFKFKRGILDFGVSSEVAVARTAASAASELAAIRGERVKRCFSRYLDLLLQSQRHAGARLRPVDIVSGTPPAPGANGSFGWRIIASFTVQRFKLSLYVDILGFVLGPARVTLVSSGLLRPFPATVQQRLFGLLLARASSRPL
jgi:hypothetical protein